MVRRYKQVLGAILAGVLFCIGNQQSEAQITFSNNGNDYEIFEIVQSDPFDSEALSTGLTVTVAGTVAGTNDNTIFWTTYGLGITEAADVWGYDANVSQTIIYTFSEAVNDIIVFLGNDNASNLAGIQNGTVLTFGVNSGTMSALSSNVIHSYDDIAVGSNTLTGGSTGNQDGGAFRISSTQDFTQLAVQTSATSSDTFGMNIAATIPEPSSVLLLGLIGMLGIFPRRRRLE